MITTFLAGAIMMGYTVAALFFLKFWKQTRDRLFAMFALAFFILAFNYAAFTPPQPIDEFLPSHYTVRFFAFLIILVAIVDKNRSPRKP